MLDDFCIQRYDKFIRTPVIRSEIRQATVTQGQHISVYLPAVDEKLLVQQFQKIKSVQWHIFSKRVTAVQTIGHITIQPIDNENWIQSVASSLGVMMSAGFEGPSEALFLGKKLIVMPIIGQYEQLCNATALERMGIPVFRKIRHGFDSLIKDWIYEQPPVQVDYPDETAQVIQSILENEIGFSNVQVAL